jgi:hypothetical protein
VSLKKERKTSFQKSASRTHFGARNDLGEKPQQIPLFNEFLLEILRKNPLKPEGVTEL